MIQSVCRSFGVLVVLFVGMLTSSSHAATYTSTAPPINIPDNDSTGVTMSVVVPDSLTITDLNVTVHLTHNFVGDLEITLTDPSGTNTVTLMSRPGAGGLPGSSGRNLRFTTFDDEGDAGSIQMVPNDGTGQPYRGRYLPHSPLTAFDGGNSTGVWVLAVRDLSPGTTGTLRACMLTFNGETRLPSGGGIGGLSLTIPAQGDLFATMIVADAPEALTDVDVTIELTHFNAGHLEVWLLSPDGTPAFLFGQNHASGQNLNNTTFDDAVSNPINTGSSPYRGRFRTSGATSLGNFNGKNANGQWRLRVRDLVAGGVPLGVLNEWSLSFQGAQASPAPPNDLCAGATPILCGSYTAGTTTGATIDAAAACGFASAPTAPGVWYSIVGTGEAITLSTCDAKGFDTQLSIFTGACDELICVAGNDDDAQCSAADRSTVTFASIAGAMYHVLVHGKDNEAGDFVLHAVCAGNECTTAVVVNDGDVIERSLFSAPSTDVASCSTNDAADMYFAFTAPCTGRLTATTCGSHDLPGEDLGIDTVISARSQCAPGGSQLACNDNWPDDAALLCNGFNAGDAADAAIRFNVVAGETVMLRVASRTPPDSVNLGRFMLRVVFEDDVPPTIAAGAIDTCYATVAAAESAAITATTADDACSGVVLSASTTGTCNAVITVTATDDAGNTSQVTYNTSIGSRPPTMISGTIDSCSSTISEAEAAAIAATIVLDTCDPVPLVSASTEVTGCTATITVTATNACGLSSTVEYTTTVDGDAPTIKAGTIASCWPSASSAADAAIAATTASDMCGNVSLSASTSISGCSATITVTAADSCGNTSSVIYNVTIDSKPPVLIAGDISACYPDAASAIAAALAATTAEESCSIVAFSAEISGEGCDRLITVTGTDSCGLIGVIGYAVRIDDQPPVLVCGDDVEVAADAGRCDAIVSLSQPIVSDGCDGEIEIVAWRSDEHPLNQPYPTGETIVFWQAVDECGLMSEIAEQRIVVRPVNVLMVQLQVSGLADDASRCIEFKAMRCDGTAAVVMEREVTLQTDAATQVTLEVPCGEYACIMARDPKHTLWKAAHLSTSGSTYAASMTGNAALVSGNLNGDTYVDIIDFAVFIYQFGDVLGAHAPCGHTGFHADLDGDGVVYTGDYTHIQSAFLRFDDQPCCGNGNARNATPLTERDDVPAMGFSMQSSPTMGEVQVSIAQLAARGMAELAIADLNADGFVDVLDMALAGGGTQLMGRNVNIMRGGLWSANAHHHPQQREGESGGGRDVIIAGDVMLDLANAAAQRVIVMNGAMLRMMPGTQLQAQSLVVQHGGALVIDAERATLLLRELVLEHGEQLHWQQGTIEITSGTLRVQRGDLTIGSGQGAATLRLMDGTNAQLPGNLILASHTQASAVLELVGTQTHMQVRESLIAGLAGNGRITINNAAAMHAATLRIGVQPAATGIVQLSDEATQLHIENHLTIGESGTARFELDDRAKLKAGVMDLGERGEIDEVGSALRSKE